MSTTGPTNGSKDDGEQHGTDGSGTSADSLPSGAGPQTDGDQSDISSGGGTDE